MTSKLILPHTTGEPNYAGYGRLSSPQVITVQDPQRLNYLQNRTLGDIWQQATPEQKLLAAKNLGKLAINFGMDMVPGLGDVKSAQEAITGTQPILEGVPGVESKLTIPERIGAGVGALPFIPSMAGILKKVPELAPLKKIDIPTAKTGMAEGGNLELFHGSPNDIEVPLQTNDIGFHFGTKEAAQTRLDTINEGTGYIKKYTVSISNPIKAKYDPGLWDNSKEALDAIPLATKQRKEIDKRIFGMGHTESLDSINQYLQELGYDSIKYENAFEGGDSYIILNRKNIKQSHSPFRSLESSKLELPQEIKPKK